MKLWIETIRQDRLRLRKINWSMVDEIARSFIETQIQLQPIVCRGSVSDPILVAGKHRLEAARKIGWTEIEAVLTSADTGDDALLQEIDENLARGALSPVEIGLHQVERKRIMEAHEMVRRNGRPNKKLPQNEEVSSYAEATAKQQGRSRQTIERETARGAALVALVGEEKARQVIDTALDDRQQLDAITRLAKADPEKALAMIDRAIAGELVNVKAAAKKARRFERASDKAERIAAEAERLGKTRYGVIYADPPWDFQVRSEYGKDRSAENHYPVQGLDAIKAMPVIDAAFDDCVLFLWCTTANKVDALDVGRAWGFEYKSTIYWDKVNFGTGFWVRDQVEELLILSRGNPVAPAMGEQLPSLYRETKGVHSRKPDGIRDWIASTWPGTPKLEMYARTAAVGWDVWGAEAPSLTA